MYTLMSHDSHRLERPSPSCCSAPCKRPTPHMHGDTHLCLHQSPRHISDLSLKVLLLVDCETVRRGGGSTVATMVPAAAPCTGLRFASALTSETMMCVAHSARHGARGAGPRRARRVVRVESVGMPAAAGGARAVRAVGVVPPPRPPYPPPPAPAMSPTCRRRRRRRHWGPRSNGHCCCCCCCASPPVVASPPRHGDQRVVPCGCASPAPRGGTSRAPTRGRPSPTPPDAMRSTREAGSGRRRHRRARAPWRSDWTRAGGQEPCCCCCCCCWPCAPRRW